MRRGPNMFWFSRKIPRSPSRKSGGEVPPPCHPSRHRLRTAPVNAGGTCGHPLAHIGRVSRWGRGETVAPHGLNHGARHADVIGVRLIAGRPHDLSKDGRDGAPYRDLMGIVKVGQAGSHRARPINGIFHKQALLRFVNDPRPARRLPLPPALRTPPRHLVRLLRQDE